jgi:hypothetical protein
MSPLISTRAGASARGYGGLLVSSVSGDYELIEKRVLSSSTASVSFNSISSSYKHLQFFADLRNTSANATVNNSVYFNGDTTGANYQRHFLQNSYANGLSSGGSADGTFNFMYAAGQTYSANTATNHLNIYDYTSTSKYKMLTNVAMFLNNGAGSGIAQGFGGMYTGVWQNTNAITSVTFEANDGTLESGSTFWLYGIKG